MHVHGFTWLDGSSGFGLQKQATSLSIARQSIAHTICGGKLRGLVSNESAWSEYEW